MTYAEPWRDHPLTVAALPVAALKTLVDPLAESHMRRFEHHRLSELSVSIIDTGVQQPLQIVMSATHVCLGNGNHRTVVAHDLGIVTLGISAPTPSEQIRCYALPLPEFMAILAKALYTPAEQPVRSLWRRLRRS